MKISILNGEVIYWVDYSKLWAEVINLSEADASKLRAKTHKFDIETKGVVELPTPEPEPIPEPTDEEIREAKIQEVEKLLLRKQAMELVWETTDSIVTEIATKAEEVIDLSNATKTQKTSLKSELSTKLWIE